MTDATPGLSITQVTYGQRVARKSVVFHDFARYGVPDGALAMDYNFWVIRSATQTILLDTGYDIRAKDWLGEISVMPPPDGLELLGIDASAVDLVIASHFHYDHIGYLHLFANAEVVAAQAEYDYWLGKWRAGQMDGEFANADDLAAVDRAERAGRLRLVHGQTEVLPGITVYLVGGHCPGQLLTKVQTSAGPKILASDAAHFYEQVEHEWPFFAFTSLPDAKAALAFMNQLARDDDAEVIPGHDRRVRDRHPAQAGPAESVATIIA